MSSERDTSGDEEGLEPVRPHTRGDRLVSYFVGRFQEEAPGVRVRYVLDVAAVYAIYDETLEGRLFEDRRQWDLCLGDSDILTDST